MRLAIFTTLLELAGLGSLAAAALLLGGLPALLVTAGVELIVAGVLLEPSLPSKRS